MEEKQKTKSFYGVGEKQFRGYFEMASNKKGITGTVLLQILETRLDNVVYTEVKASIEILLNGISTIEASFLHSI